MALTDQEKNDIVAAVATSVVTKLKESGNALVVGVEKAAPAEDKKRDPYRPALHFLAGLLAFCLTLIVALFAALNPDKGHVVNSLIIWVLMGIAATAAAGTVAIGLLQWAKSRSPDTFNDFGKVGVAAGIIAVLFGVGTVLLCFRGALLVAERNCIAKPAEATSEPALIEFLKIQDPQWRSYTREYAQARARDCLINGDLASSQAWARIWRAAQ